MEHGEVNELGGTHWMPPILACPPEWTIRVSDTGVEPTDTGETIPIPVQSPIWR